MNVPETDEPARPVPPVGLVCVRCGGPAVRLLAEPAIAYCVTCETESATRILAELSLPEP